MSSLRVQQTHEATRDERTNEPAHSAGFDDVVEQLLAVAARLETAAREHDKLAPLEELARVREGAARSRGELRALYEVAEAFLHAFDRGDFGALGVELARFVREHESVAREVLVAASGLHGLKAGDVPPAVATKVHELVALGALRETDGVIRVRPSVRSAVAELVEPPSVRMWRLVERARRSVLTAPPARRPELLAQRLGVDVTLAREVLGTTANAAASSTAHRKNSPTAGARVLTRREVYAVDVVVEPAPVVSEEDDVSPHSTVTEALRGLRGQGPTLPQESTERRAHQGPSILHSAALH